tara:strand:+ start:858 stop:1901 length:1044 start_codon:yes stop_codon:yes gene_type:complete
MALTKITRAILDTGISDSSNATAITIDSSENVGIGATSPQSRLEIAPPDNSTANKIIFSHFPARADANDVIAGGIESQFRTRDANVNTGAFIRILDVNTNSSFPTQIRGGEIVFGTIDGATGFASNPAVERVRITTDGKLGINTTSPSYMLTVKSSSENHLRLENGSELGVFVLNTDGDIKIWAHGADERIQFLNGTGSGTSIAAFDSHGLKFGSDTAATNALDDYEEGTWTPTIASGGTVSSTSARYTKIGDTVRATARLSNFSFSQVDGTALQIGGLPYSMHSDSNVGFAWGNTGTQGKAVYFWSGSGGGSSMYAYWSGSGYDSTTHNEVPSGFNLLINLVYGHG